MFRILLKVLFSLYNFINSCFYITRPIIIFGMFMRLSKTKYVNVVCNIAAKFLFEIVKKKKRFMNRRQVYLPRPMYVCVHVGVRVHVLYLCACACVGAIRVYIYIYIYIYIYMCVCVCVSVCEIVCWFGFIVINMSAGVSLH